MKVTWRDSYPGETMFGGRGIVIPFRYNAPDKGGPVSSPDPSLSEDPGAQEPEASADEYTAND